MVILNIEGGNDHRVVKGLPSDYPVRTLMAILAIVGIYPGSTTFSNK